MECAGDEESHVVDHVSIRHVVHELCERSDSIGANVSKLGYKLIRRLGGQAGGRGVRRERGKEIAVSWAKLKLQICKDRSVTKISMMALQETSHTIDGLALCQVIVRSASKETVAISSNNALDIATKSQYHPGCGIRLLVTYPLFTLKNKPSMMMQYDSARGA